MKQYWFTSKRYGYGFCPISWQGWLATLSLLVCIFIFAYLNQFFTPQIDTKSGFIFLFEILVSAVVFTFLFRDKVKGGLKWRWGK